MSERTSKLIFSQNFENQLSSASVSSISSFQHHLSAKAKGSCFVFQSLRFLFLFVCVDGSIFRSFDPSILRSFDPSIFRSFDPFITRTVPTFHLLVFVLMDRSFDLSIFRSFDLSIFRSFDLSFFRSFQSALLQEIQNQSTVRFFLSKKGGESPFLCAFRFPISGGLANAVEPSRRPNGGNKHDSTGSFLDFASVSFTLSSLLYFLSLFAHFNGSHLTSG